MSEIAHYCQRCLAANPLGQDFCARCGTRLMIVVEPASVRFESVEGTPSSDEHLLERISSLENRLSRLTDKLERGLDLLLRQAQNSYYDRALVKALISLLAEDGLVESERLERLWNERCQKDAAEQEENTRREDIRLRVLASREGDGNHEFEKLVNQAFSLLEDKQQDQGMRMLQRAAQIEPENQVLLSFLGEFYFRAGKTKLVRTYLGKALNLVPNDVRVSLLLGLACADEGDPERAKELLHNTTRLGGPSFAAHYGLGRLFAAEEDWSQALREFKRALSSNPSPEAHYVLGCFYYQLSRDSLALRHLRKAIKMDESYGEALALIGLIYKRNGQTELSREAFAAAAAVDTLRSSSKRVQLGAASVPLFDLTRLKPGKFLTGGDRRLADALREQALKAFAP